MNARRRRCLSKTSANRSLNDFVNVSEKMNVPARNDVPRMTAREVSSKRPLRAMMPFRAILNIDSVTEPLHAIEHEIGRRLGHLVDDLAVGEEDDPVRVARRIGVVGDHHDRLPEIA